MRRRNFLQPLVPLVLLTAGEDEAVFFSQMRRECRYANLQVFRKSADSLSLPAMIREAGRLRLEYGNGYAWCLFNPFDIEISPGDLTEAQKLAKTKRVAMAYTNPGLELWFYLHFAVPENPFSSRAESVDALQKFLPDFQPGADYLREQGSDLYLRLFAHKGQAVLNANRYNMLFGSRAGLGTPRLDNSCTVGRFLKSVNDVCGRCYMTPAGG